MYRNWIMREQTSRSNCFSNVNNFSIIRTQVVCNVYNYTNTLCCVGRSSLCILPSCLVVPGLNWLWLIILIITPASSMNISIPAMFLTELIISSSFWWLLYQYSSWPIEVLLVFFLFIELRIPSHLSGVLIKFLQQAISTEGRFLKTISVWIPISNWFSLNLTDWIIWVSKLNRE